MIMGTFATDFVKTGRFLAVRPTQLPLLFPLQFLICTAFIYHFNCIIAHISNCFKQKKKNTHPFNSKLVICLPRKNHELIYSASMFPYFDHCAIHNNKGHKKKSDELKKKKKRIQIKVLISESRLCLGSVPAKKNCFCHSADLFMLPA